MEIQVEQVGPRIRQATQGMTDNEQQMTRDLLGMGMRIKDFTIHEIAARHSVSAAFVVKVAQRCGFSGFRELKAALLEYSQLPVVDLHEELNPQDDTTTVVAKVFNTAINALKETLAIFDFTAMARAAEALRQAQTIDFYGVGGSGALALDAYHKFLRIGVRTQVCTDSHLMMMSAAMLKPGGVLIDVKSALDPATVPAGVTYWCL